MKLRVQGDSIRIRLNQTEVQLLAEGKKVEQITKFSPSSQFVTFIESKSQISDLSASLRADGIAVQVPSRIVQDWAKTEQVGIEADQPAGEGQFLHILVEKDFQCLHDRSVLDEDAFPNPRLK